MGDRPAGAAEGWTSQPEVISVWLICDDNMQAETANNPKTRAGSVNKRIHKIMTKLLQRLNFLYQDNAFSPIMN